MPRLRLPFISRRKWDKLRDALIRERGDAYNESVACRYAGALTKELESYMQFEAYSHALELLELIEHEK